MAQSVSPRSPSLDYKEHMENINKFKRYSEYLLDLIKDVKQKNSTVTPVDDKTVKDVQMIENIKNIEQTLSFFGKVTGSYKKFLDKTKGNKENYKQKTDNNLYFAEKDAINTTKPTISKNVCPPNDFTHMYIIKEDFKGVDLSSETLIADFNKALKDYNDAKVQNKESSSLIGATEDEIYSKFLLTYLYKYNLIFKGTGYDAIPDLKNGTNKIHAMVGGIKTEEINKAYDMPERLEDYLENAAISIGNINKYVISFIKILLAVYNCERNTSDSYSPLYNILNIEITEHTSIKDIQIGASKLDNYIYITQDLFERNGLPDEFKRFIKVKPNAIVTDGGVAEAAWGGGLQGYESYQQEQEQQQQQQGQQSLLEVLQQTSQQLEQMSKAPKKKTTKL
jgi:hypothetical protein